MNYRKLHVIVIFYTHLIIQSINLIGRCDGNYHEGPDSIQN